MIFKKIFRFLLGIDREHSINSDAEIKNNAILENFSDLSTEDNIDMASADNIRTINKPDNSNENNSSQNVLNTNLPKNEKKYDTEQQKVIDFIGGKAIVLAAPGCGKTEILSQRIMKAHTDYGISYEDMLCVTFTNRAAREMKKRVSSVAGCDDIFKNLFVGNLHRFCLKFLLDNGIIPQDTSILDETDQQEIIKEIIDLPREPYAYEIKAVTDCAAYDFEVKNNFPLRLRIHRCDGASRFFGDMYIEYKEENNAIDFDDILLMTYREMMSEKFRNGEYKRSSYKWIQVDEIQDLNPLQLAIIDRLTADENSTLVYLGDKGQAIFSFMGANINDIDGLCSQCGKNIFYLSSNYRSPSYLLDMLNDYAVENLEICRDKLPTAKNDATNDDALKLFSFLSYRAENTHEDFATDLVLELSRYGGSIGVLARSNREVESISNSLSERGIEHMKITNRDMFKMINFKTMHGHFSVVCNETSYEDWARVLYQTKVIQDLTDSRAFIREMKEKGITPADLINYNGSSYAIEFAASYGNKELVIFDTETTGLDIFEDDIIQIAAVKIRNGRQVPGSELDIVIRTEKEIPSHFSSGKINPMREEYERRSRGIKGKPHELFLPAREAFTMFLEYIGNDELLGHNASKFDIHILKSNIMRRTELKFSPPVCWDTLKLSRLLKPKQKGHGLESLLEQYGLEGINSHNASDDVLATKSVAEYFHGKILPLINTQREFLRQPETKIVQERLIRRYAPLYSHTAGKLFSDAKDEEHTFLREFEYVYGKLLESNCIKPIDRFSYMKALFEEVVFSNKEEKYFSQQVANHLFELRTFNEADLYANGIISENIYVMTIHKAKGLEFDNVIVYNVNDGIFPYFKSLDKVEDAKVLYVAMSRARKRLWMSYDENANLKYPRKLSRFIASSIVRTHFKAGTQYQQPKKNTECMLQREDAVQFCYNAKHSSLLVKQETASASLEKERKYTQDELIKYFNFSGQLYGGITCINDSTILLIWRSTSRYNNKYQNGIIYYVGQDTGTNEQRLIYGNKQLYEAFNNSNMHIHLVKDNIYQGEFYVCQKPYIENGKWIFPLKSKSSNETTNKKDYEIKVGTLARTELRKILESGTIDENEIKKLQTIEYSKQVFGIKFALLLLESGQKKRPEHYYKDRLTINGKQYFMTCEWYERNLSYLKKWIEKERNSSQTDML